MWSLKTWTQNDFFFLFFFLKVQHYSRINVSVPVLQLWWRGYMAWFSSQQGGHQWTPESAGDGETSWVGPNSGNPGVPVLVGNWGNLQSSLQGLWNAPTNCPYGGVQSDRWDVTPLTQDYSSATDRGWCPICGKWFCSAGRIPCLFRRWLGQWMAATSEWNVLLVLMVSPTETTSCFHLLCFRQCVTTRAVSTSLWDIQAACMLHAYWETAPSMIEGLIPHQGIST